MLILLSTGFSSATAKYADFSLSMIDFLSCSDYKPSSKVLLDDFLTKLFETGAYRICSDKDAVSLAVFGAKSSFGVLEISMFIALFTGEISLAYSYIVSYSGDFTL